MNTQKNSIDTTAVGNPPAGADPAAPAPMAPTPSPALRRPVGGNITSHELARQLLDGPDLPVLMHKVESYAEEDGASPMIPVSASPETVEGPDGERSLAIVFDGEVDGECQRCLATPCMCAAVPAIRALLSERHRAIEQNTELSSQP